MGIKDELMKIVKTSSSIKKVYNMVGSGLLKFVGLFISQDEKLILINSFGGKKYDDSPKAIYEYLKQDERFKDYKVVWAFHEPEKFDVPGATVIKTDNLKYFITAMKARVWITNSGIERGLSFEKKGTIYINTWHGTPIKYMGSDEYKIDPSQMPVCKYDRQNAQSKFEADVFSRVFNIPYERMLVCGYPRNDILISNDRETQNKYKEKLGLPLDKKVILYAPTFREYERDSARNCVLRPPIDFEKWKKVLGDDYVVLMRCHYEVAKLLNVGIDGEFVRDFSDYPTLNHLMLASDMLISDYSSIVFDYAILDRPIIVYTYDFETYKEKRGMYLDVREELIGGSVSEDELLGIIKNLDKQEALKKVREFRGKYVTAYGHATEGTVDALWELIQRSKR